MLSQRYSSVSQRRQSGGPLNSMWGVPVGSQSANHTLLVNKLRVELSARKWLVVKQAHVRGRLVNESAPECAHGHKPARGGYIDVGQDGCSDLVVHKPGRTVWIEVKTGDGKLAPNQIQWTAAMRARGFIVIEARSVEQVIEALG